MKAFIFDADGVLFRSFGDDGKFLWTRDIEADLGLDAAALKHLFSGRWHDAICGRHDTRQHVEEVFHQHKISLHAQEFIDYWLAKDSALDTEMLDFVSSLDKSRCFVATNQDRLRAARLAAVFGDRFKTVFASCDIGFMKPDSGFYEYIENKIGCAPENIFFTDDTKANCDAAFRRGWQTHHYQGLAGLKEALGA